MTQSISRRLVHPASIGATTRKGRGMLFQDQVLVAPSTRPPPCRAAPRLRPPRAGAALSALFRENKLRNEASVSQTALKVVQAQREVFELYYRLPSSVSKPGWSEIDLLDYGQAACFESRAHYHGAHKGTRLLFAEKQRVGEALARLVPWLPVR
jgi:hypothetical protein